MAGVDVTDEIGRVRVILRQRNMRPSGLCCCWACMAHECVVGLARKTMQLTVLCYMSLQLCSAGMHTFSLQS